MSKEIKTELIPIRIELQCDCRGMIVGDRAGVLKGFNTYHNHRCDKCGKEEVFQNKFYPYIDYINK